MITASQEQTVLTLIGRGASEREIALQAGVARGTVRSRKAGHRQKRRYGRCACGAVVLLPCRACQLRQLLGIKED